jgi:hypothetical protein
MSRRATMFLRTAVGRGRGIRVWTLGPRIQLVHVSNPDKEDLQDPYPAQWFLEVYTDYHSGSTAFFEIPITEGKKEIYRRLEQAGCYLPREDR